MTERRAYRDLVRNLDEGHPTLSAIAPLVCFCSALTILVLLRAISIFGVVAARCVDTDEFWYSSTGGNVPLAGSFILALALLFVWNLLIGIDDWKRSQGTRVVVVVNALAIVAMLYVFSAIHDAAAIAYNQRAGFADSITSYQAGFLPWKSESECVTMRRFAGRWRVVARDVGLRGFNIPAEWIELKPWGYVYAQDASWLKPYALRWEPPSRHSDSPDDRWRDGFLFGSPWDFELQGDTLVLETTDWFENEWERSRIVFEREAIRDEPEFFGSYATGR